jgi:hypothetical protein
MSRITNESRSIRGSSVYLTVTEKESLKRAIKEYIESVEGAEDKGYIEFFEKYDETPLHTAYKKLCK